jgi:hypothetical protein
MKYLLSLILLIGYLLFDCPEIKKHSTGTPSNSTIGSNKEIPVQTLDDSVVTDIDGNTYPIVLIGTRFWMASNLNVSTYNNGKPIPLFSGGGLSTPEEKGVYVIYNNKEATESKYGKLYNFYTVSEGNLCPKEWHVPSEEEWQEMINLNGLSRLNLLPGGSMNSGELSPFSGLETEGYWWTSTSVGRNTAAYFSMQYGTPELKRGGANEGNFFSVRCVKNK